LSCRTSRFRYKQNPLSLKLKKGDKVKVINTTQVSNLRRGKLYGGGTFVVYRDSYDVIQVNGDAW
jgi:hypothetical protein